MYNMCEVCACMCNACGWGGNGIEGERRGQIHQDCLYLSTIWSCNKKMLKSLGQRKNWVDSSEKEDNQCIVLLKSHFDDTVPIAL